MKVVAGHTSLLSALENLPEDLREEVNFVATLHDRRNKEREEKEKESEHISKKQKRS